MTLRRIGLLLTLAAAAWAEEPDWTASQVTDQRRSSVDDDTVLNDEIEDLLSRKEIDKVGYAYDRWGIWDKPYFEISVGVWAVGLAGPVRLGTLNVVDLSSGLGLDDTIAAPLWGIGIRNSWWEIILDGYSADSTGSTVVDADFELPTVPPTPVQIGDIVSSGLKIQSLRLLGGWRVFRRPVFTASLLLGVSTYRIKGFIRSETANAQTNFDGVLPLPVLGVAFYGRFGKRRRWEYRAEVVGIAINVDTFGGNIVDARGTIGYRVVDWFVIRVGYRFADVGAFVDNIRVDFELAGPFLELVGEF